jgi:ferredoxin
MKAIVIADVCIGCGLCVEICPEVFHMGGEKAIVYSDPVPEKKREACQQAADQCPVENIQIT